MSIQKRNKRVAAPDIAARKGGEPIVSLTAYHAHTAKILDPYVDFLLVGDSLGMVMHGYETTVPVPLDLMIMHGAAVVRGSSQALVVVDMPFGSYEESPEIAFRNAARVMKETGCGAVKLEGGEEMAETVSFLVARGVPVLGHVGLEPQSVKALGGFRAQGREPADAERILKDGAAIARAGAFAIVVEGTVEPVARTLTETIPVPTIGIGASPACDGQILVTEDILGLSGGMAPSFVKRYAALDEAVAAAATGYAEDVRARRFPTAEHCFGVRRSGS